MKQTGSAIRLDAVDLRILATLQRDSRITKAALAERVTLSATPCWQRLKRLERAGLIRGYRAELALEKIAGFTTVLVEVILKQHRYEDFEPGRRYDEAEVNHIIGRRHLDFAALRRFLVDEELLQRRDSIYWRTGSVTNTGHDPALWPKSPPTAK